MRRSRLCRAVLALLLCAGGLMVAAAPSRATFPGANGVFAYTSREGIGSERLYLSGSGQLTDGRYKDQTPAWSPDGKQLAFTRLDEQLADNSEQRDFLIMVINRDGTGVRQIISSDAFDRGSSELGFEQASLFDPTWTADGQKISFVVKNARRIPTGGIWTIGVDGTGLTQTVADPDAWKPDQLGPEWSPQGDELAFTCQKRLGARDFCIYDQDTGVTRLVPVDQPGRTGFFNPVKWWPDGTKLAFVLGVNEQSGNHIVRKSEVFTVNRDGSGLTRITNSGDACPGTGATVSFPDVLYDSPAAPSPDGKSILVKARRKSGTLITNDCGYTETERGLWTVNPSGGGGSLLLANELASEPDWQPLPPKLTVRIDDGHGNLLKGLKVELRTVGGSVIDDEPTRTPDGDYVFAELPSGDEYIVRATLVDHAGEPGSVPSFDVRHTENGVDPVWIDLHRSIGSHDAPIVEELSFEDAPSLSDSNVEANLRDRLDDMANIYFRTRQFVDWLKENVLPDTGRTVRYHTFATTDPITGKDVDWDGAHYNPGNSLVVFGIGMSEYEERDGVVDPAHDDGAPENGEWHEFAHHLWHDFVNDRTGCNPFTMRSHFGWNNPDTCDSMDEGFGTFLAARAGQDIEGSPDANYGNMFNLETHTKAWNYDGGRVQNDSVPSLPSTLEDVAVAALLWDLTDDTADAENTDVINALGSHQPVTYTDNAGLSVGDLWAILISSQPGTVVDFRNALDENDPASITEDLDADGVTDVSSLDHVFLMHGFFPVPANDQEITPAHRAYHYDVDTAQDADPTALRNAAIGRTDHVELDKDGNIIGEFTPREKAPQAPRANVEVGLRDASGTPLGGGTVDLAVHYPGLQDNITRRLGSGDGALVHLEVPPYFDYELPLGAPLPPCDPTHDVRVDVTLSANVNGYTSADQPSFDNCTYQRAAAEAEGPGALSFAFVFPEDSLAPQTTIEKAFAEAPDGTTGTWTVSLGCADPVDNGFASGCLRTEYRIDGGDIQTYDEPVEIPDRRTLEYRSLDAAGNSEPFRSIRLSAFDDVGPTISITSPADGAPYILNQAVNSEYSCSDEGSGVSSCQGPLDSGAPIDTSTLGEHEFTVAATDEAGNASSLTHSYRVLYDTEAFLSPIKNPPSLNEKKVNASVPLKWRLRDVEGRLQIDLTEEDVGFEWVAIDCDTRAVTGGTTPASSAEGLSYNQEGQHYLWVTKAPPSLAGTCQRLEMKLNDGSVHSAEFRFG